MEVRIPTFARTAQGYVAYEIESKLELKNSRRSVFETVRVNRRFSEFLALKAALPAGRSGTPLPSKYRGTLPEARRPSLETYLRELLGLQEGDSGSVNKRYEDLNDVPLELLEFLNLASYCASTKAVVYGEFPPLAGDLGAACSRALEKVQANLAHMKSSTGDWKAISRASLYTCYARPHTAELGPAMRGIVAPRVAAPARWVHDTFQDLKQCMVMEKNIASGEIIEVVSPQTQVCYFVMKPMQFLSPRDIIMVRTWRVLPDGSVLHVEFSLPEHPKAPASGAEGRVRCSLSAGGALLEPLGNGHSTRVTRLNDLDPVLGDAVPQWALNKVNEFTAGMMALNMDEMLKLMAQEEKLGRVQAYRTRSPLVNANGVEAARGEAEEEEEEEAPEQTTGWDAGMTLAFLVGGGLGATLALYAHA